MHSGYSLRQRRHLRYRFKELCVLQIIAQHPFSFNFVMCLLSYLAAGIFSMPHLWNRERQPIFSLQGLSLPVHRGMSARLYFSLRFTAVFIPYHNSRQCRYFAAGGTVSDGHSFIYGKKGQIHTAHRYYRCCFSVPLVLCSANAY